MEPQAVADIVTLQQVQAAYPNLDTGQLADAPGIISAVSMEIARRYPYCSPPADYDELADPEFSRGFTLSRRPVIQIHRFRVDNWRVIYCNYSGPARRATAATTQTGDVGATATTGISLTTETNGAATTTTLDAATYPTVGQLVTAINGVAGFSATAAADQTDMPTADLEPGQGPYNAKVTTAWLYGFTRDVNDFTLDPRTGEVTMYEWRAPSYRFPDRVWGADQRSTQIRVTYRAGRATTDPDVARAALLVIGDEIETTERGTFLATRFADNSGYTVGSPSYKFPPTAHRILSRFRERRFA